MNKIAISAALASLAVSPIALAQNTAPASSADATSSASAPKELKKGSTLYNKAGGTLAKIYRVNARGDAEIILNNRMVTVPASSISNVDGKLVVQVANSQELLGGR